MSAPLLPNKLDLFYWWLTDNFGEEEGNKLYAAALSAQRFMTAIEKHGDFNTARQSLLSIAMALPDAGQTPAFPPDPNLDNESARKWRELMQKVYA